MTSGDPIRLIVAGEAAASRQAAQLLTLDEGTRQDNARFFTSPDEVPTHAVTQGIDTILRARRLIVLAFGKRKARALSAALSGQVTPQMPASALQLHPDVIVLADADAASLLPG
jgi:glucosamine-6-phosphate deaminase